MRTHGDAGNGSLTANGATIVTSPGSDRVGPLSTPRGTVLAVLLPPLMWSLHELTVYIGTSNLCRLGLGEQTMLGMPAARLFILVATAIALAVIGWMLLTFRRQRQATGAPDDGLGPTTLERVGFAVRFGTVFAVISAIGVILTALPTSITVCG